MKGHTNGFVVKKQNISRTYVFVSSFVLLSITSLSFFYNFYSPPHMFEESNRHQSSSINTTEASVTKAQAPKPHSHPDCDMSKGEWERDPHGPYYTNTTCWTIQDHQNCLKYGRPDTEFLRWRWMPDGCELQLFDPVEFFELVRGKSMAFVGDSLARNQMQSLMCLLSRVGIPKDVSDSSDDNFKQMFYTSYNFTISSFWSPFLVNAEEGHLEGISWSGLWNVYLDEADDRWISSINKFDYVIISGGNWFTRPTIFFKKRKVVGSNYFLHHNITRLTMYYGHKVAFDTALDSIRNMKSYKGITVLRTVSPSHFEDGTWNNGGNCVRTRPFGRNEKILSSMDVRLYNDQMNAFWKARREGEKKGLKFRLLDATQAMLLRPDGHPSRYGHWPDDQNVTSYNDCVHWCLPGPVDMWNDLLLHTLKL